MSVTSALQRLRKNAGYHGWPSAFQLLFVDLLRKFVVLERIHLYALETLPAGMEFPANDRARLATLDELKLLNKDPVMDMTEWDDAKLDELWRDGHRCVLNLDGTKVVGYSWMRFDRIEIPVLKAGFGLRPEEGYIYKGFTRPDSRGKNVANDRFLCWLRFIQETGRRSAVTYFAFDNKATLRRVEKLNMRKLGTATRIKIGRLQKLFRCGDYRNRELYPL
jgi:hypothetical protein